MYTQSEVSQTTVSGLAGRPAPTAAGLRKTQFRSLVLEIFKNAAPLPMTARDVVECLEEQKQVQVHSSLVYRTARDLEYAGFLLRKSENGVMSWQAPSANAEQICNIVCSRCHFSMSIPGAMFRQQIQKAALEYGVDLGNQALSLYMNVGTDTGCQHLHPGISEIP